ncbi:31220_t:CDS:2, partial [Gigaspora margarita]
FIAAVIAYYVHPVNIQTACLIMEGAEFTENIINGVERPVKAAELFAFTLRVRAGNTDVLTDAEENVRQKLRKKRSGARPGRPQPLRGTKGKRKGARLWYVGGQQF